MENTTQLYRDVVALTAAFEADALNLAKLRELEAAEQAYYEAIAAARAAWRALPAGDRKDSAEQNAYETEGCDVDQLRWYQIAIMTYDLNK